MFFPMFGMLRACGKRRILLYEKDRKREEAAKLWKIYGKGIPADRAVVGRIYHACVESGIFTEEAVGGFY